MLLVRPPQAAARMQIENGKWKIENENLPGSVSRQPVATPGGGLLSSPEGSAAPSTDYGQKTSRPIFNFPFSTFNFPLPIFNSCSPRRP